MFTSHCICVYSFRPLEQFINEHMIPMATTSKTKPKLPTIQEKLDFINKVHAT